MSDTTIPGHTFVKRWATTLAFVLFLTAQIGVTYKLVDYRSEFLRVNREVCQNRTANGEAFVELLQDISVHIEDPVVQAEIDEYLNKGYKKVNCP